MNENQNNGVINVGKFTKIEDHYQVPVHIDQINYDLYSFEMTIKINPGVSITNITLADELTNCFFYINQNNPNEIRIALASTETIESRENILNIQFTVNESETNKVYFTIDNSKLNEFTQIIELNNVINLNVNMDLNNDGVINEQDLHIFIQNYNNTYKQEDISDIDVNADGIIDIFDIIAAKNK